MKRISPTTKMPSTALRWVASLGATALILSAIGCTTGSRYQQSTGEYIDDHGLSSAVRKALGKDMQYKFDDVNVATFKGVVQLSGFAATNAQKSRAGELAMTVHGVKEVVNSITIKE